MYKKILAMFRRSDNSLLLLLVPSIFLCLIYGGYGPAPSGLIYDRLAIEKGEFWRLITSHFVHGDLKHLGMNMIALMCISPFMRSIKQLIKYFVIFSFMISISIWLFLPNIAYYCGASAILNSLLVMVLWDEWQKKPHKLLVAIMIVAIGKTLFEIENGDSVLSIYTWPALPQSHLFGLISAVFYVLILQLKVYLKRKDCEGSLF